MYKENVFPFNVIIFIYSHIPKKAFPVYTGSNTIEFLTYIVLIVSTTSLYISAYPRPIYESSNFIS